MKEESVAAGQPVGARFYYPLDVAEVVSLAEGHVTRVGRSKGTIPYC